MAKSTGPIKIQKRQSANLVVKKHNSRMKLSKSPLKCTKTISKVEQYFNVDHFQRIRTSSAVCGLPIINLVCKLPDYKYIVQLHSTRKTR